MTRLGSFFDLVLEALDFDAKQLEEHPEIAEMAAEMMGQDKMTLLEIAKDLDVIFEGNLDYFVFDQATGEEKECTLYFFNISSIIRFSVNKIFKGNKAYVNIKVQKRDSKTFKYGPWKKNDIFTEPKFIKHIVQLADNYKTPPIEVTVYEGENE